MQLITVKALAKKTSTSITKDNLDFKQLPKKPKESKSNL